HEELPRIFDRFHRIENTRSRTHEGSGIGLALVQELVRLHGGTIQAESAVGVGTTFVVTVLRGKDHLPADRISGPRTIAHSGRGALPFVEEALRWLPDTMRDSTIEGPQEIEPNLVASNTDTAERHNRERRLVLVVDDNADMRQYLARILEQEYE